jgi:hypothetical protein
MDLDKEESGIALSQEIEFCTLGMFIIGKNQNFQKPFLFALLPFSLFISRWDRWSLF